MVDRVTETTIAHYGYFFETNLLGIQQVEYGKLPIILIEGVHGKKPQVTSDELLDSPSNCLVFTLETKGEFHKKGCGYSSR